MLFLGFFKREREITLVNQKNSTEKFRVLFCFVNNQC